MFRISDQDIMMGSSGSFKKVLFLVLSMIFLSLNALKGQKDLTVYLNHFYKVVDDETYADIANSEFLRKEFSIGDLRETTTSSGDSWTGIYLYGDKNYIEFFGENFRPTTVTGIGFGVEEKGAVKQVESQLMNHFGIPPKTELVDRNYNDNWIPWFHSVGMVPDYDGKTDLITWVMEYDQQFLEGWFPDLSAASGIERASILTHYKAKVSPGSVNQTTYFKNVTRLELALAKGFLNRLKNELEAFGYKISKKGKTYVCRGPDIVFKLIPASEDFGVRRMDLTLNKTKDGQKEYRFGKKSILKFNNDLTAVWTF